MGIDFYGDGNRFLSGGSASTWAQHGFKIPDDAGDGRPIFRSKMRSNFSGIPETPPRALRPPQELIFDDFWMIFHWFFIDLSSMLFDFVLNRWWIAGRVCSGLSTCLIIFNFLSHWLYPNPFKIKSDACFFEVLRRLSTDVSSLCFGDGKNLFLDFMRTCILLKCRFPLNSWLLDWLHNIIMHLLFLRHGTCHVPLQCCTIDQLVHTQS